MKKKKGKIAVVGGGAAGLFFAHAALEQGYGVELFESHSKPGGSASYFGRNFEAGRASFDAGATLLWGLDASFPFLKTLLTRWKVEIPRFERRNEMYFDLEGDKFELRVSSFELLKNDLQKAFIEEPKDLWSKFDSLYGLALKLKSFMDKGAHLPLETPQDLFLNLSRFKAIASVAPDFVAKSQRSLKEELLEAGATEKFLKWVDMTLLISLQDRSQNVSALLGCLALFFYTFGVGSLDGGMKSLFVALKENLEQKTELHFRTEVSRISKESDNSFSLQTSKGEKYSNYSHVVSAIPRYNLKELTKLPVKNCGYELFEKGLWSAMVAYFVVKDDQKLFPREAFNTHLKSRAHGEHYLSFSSSSDVLSCPLGFRRFTMSTHESPRGWPCEDRAQSRTLKLEKAKVLRGAFLEAFPEAKIVFEDYGSPQTFFRYTKRKNGTVGGIPLNFEHSLLKSPSQRSGVKNLYLIGDTSFPGQSVYSCALGALLCLEKISNRTLLS